MGPFAGDRTNLERKFREWLTRCHATLDKRIRFVGLAEPAMQVLMPPLASS